MSFFSSILDLGKKALGFFTGNSVGSQLAKTALSYFVLKKTNQAVVKANSTPQFRPPDPGVRLQINPDQNNRIPVLYGEAFVPGIITDAHISADQKNMTYVFTLSERTGTKISDDLPSSYEFEDVYLNDQRVVFKNDGITVDYTLDRDGNQDISLRDLITIRFYAGGSDLSFQTQQQGGSPITAVSAWDVVPTWTTFHVMYDLIFAVVTVTYNSEKGLKSVPTMLFHLRNSMTLPGDVLWDYATNPRYGAGIPEESIYRE